MDDKGSVVDGAVAQDLSQLHSIWSLREHAPVAVSLAGYTYKYDVSVPVKGFQTLADETRRRLRGLLPEGEGEVTVVAFGHLGDGNLHLNICVPGAAGAGAVAGATCAYVCVSTSLCSSFSCLLASVGGKCRVIWLGR